MAFAGPDKGKQVFKGGKGLGKGLARKLGTGAKAHQGASRGPQPTFQAGLQPPHARRKGIGLAGLDKRVKAKGVLAAVMGPEAKSVARSPILQQVIHDEVRKSLRQQGIPPENEGLSRPDRVGSGGLLSGRAKASTTAGNSTADEHALHMQPLLQNKAFKDNTYRVHLKGARDGSGRTSGIRPYYTESGSRSWSDEHETVRNALSGKLMANAGFTPLKANASPWGAENSHLARKAMHGPDDVLNAPPASVHQNTEMLAIETGVEHLESTWGDRLRVKITGYVHDEHQGDLAGTLKAFRYKVLLRDEKAGWQKVFDHVGSGQRGNIDVNEARALRAKVEALDLSDSKRFLPSLKPASGGSFLPGKGVHGDAPGEPDIRKGSGSSGTSPMVTGMRHAGANRNFDRKEALSHMQGLVSARARQIRTPDSKT